MVGQTDCNRKDERNQAVKVCFIILFSFFSITFTFPHHLCFHLFRLAISQSSSPSQPHFSSPHRHFGVPAGGRLSFSTLQFYSLKTLLPVILSLSCILRYLIRLHYISPSNLRSLLLLSSLQLRDLCPYASE